MDQRDKIPEGKQGDCTICSYLNVNTASDYEWDCLIINKKICETHCTEIQIEDYEDTRKTAASISNWQSQQTIDMLSICKTCPFGPIG